MAAQPETAFGVVNPRMEEFVQKADVTIDEMDDFIDEMIAQNQDAVGDISSLDNFKYSFGGVSTAVNNAENAIDGFDFPPASDITAQSFNIGSNFEQVPAAYNGTTVFNYNLSALGSVPTFTEDAPELTYPPTPAPINVAEPGNAPTVETDFPISDAPVVNLPAAPTIGALNLPTLDTVNLPSFTQAVPLLDIVLPNNTFNFSEVAYNSQLLTDVSTLLQQRLQGGSGFDITVEQQIWDRARNRESFAATRSKEELDFDNAQTGFSRPTGSLFAARDRLAQETQNKIADLSREIAIKQADLEQENLKTSIQDTLVLEQFLLGHHNDTMNRALDTAKTAQQVAIDIYNTRASNFQLEIEIFKLYEIEFKNKLQSELSKLDVFQKEIDGQRLLLDVDKNKIDIYNAQLEGIKTSVELYKTEVDTVVARLQAEGLKVENFKTEVDAFTARIAGKREEYNAFSAAVEAEETKVKAYDSKVRAFAARIDAYGRHGEVLAKNKELELSIEANDRETFKLSREEYKEKVDRLKDINSAELQKFSQFQQEFQLRIESAKSELDSYLAAQGAELALERLGADISKNNSDLSLANLDKQTSLLTESLKVAAQLKGQLAASSFGTINLSGSLQHSNSYTTTDSTITNL